MLRRARGVGEGVEEGYFSLAKHPTLAHGVFLFCVCCVGFESLLVTAVVDL